MATGTIKIYKTEEKEYSLRNKGREVESIEAEGIETVVTHELNKSLAHINRERPEERAYLLQKELRLMFGL